MVFLSIPNNDTIYVDPITTTVSAFENLVHHCTDFPRRLIHYSLRTRSPSRCALRDSNNSNSIILSDLGVYRFPTVIIHVPVLGGMPSTTSMKPRLDFLNSKLLLNYVASLGRGAIGFTTRSDISYSNFNHNRAKSLGKLNVSR
ncbi:unnamed protein product [Cochlearia groenlandica]